MEILKEYSGSATVSAAMRHSVMAGGKRIRPILCIAAFEAVTDQETKRSNESSEYGDLIDVACAIEMTHTYSLIHDDLPAMDNDDLRRGKPTCHKAFDEATAILAGDALLTHAFEIISSTGINSKKDNRIYLEIIRRLAWATGSRGMVEGQMLDIHSENKRLSIDEIKRIHSLKTGAFMESAVYCGALFWGGAPRQMERLNRYAKNIGLAFQVTDDILNVVGHPDEMGKAAGSDEKRNKSAYPSLMGLDESIRFAGKLIDAALESIRPFDQRCDPLRAVAQYIIERKK